MLIFEISFSMFDPNPNEAEVDTGFPHKGKQTLMRQRGGISVADPEFLERSANPEGMRQIFC